jgi:hypothetical protein
MAEIGKKRRRNENLRAKVVQYLTVYDKVICQQVQDVLVLRYYITLQPLSCTISYYVHTSTVHLYAHRTRKLTQARP